MNFQELYKKIADLDKPVSEECGGMTPSMPSEPPTAPPSVSINMNAQGMDNIESLLKLVSKVNPDMPEPAMNDPIIKIGMPGQDTMNDELDPEAYENEAYENEPEEHYDDHIKMIRHLAGGMNKEKTMVKHSYKQGDNPMAMPESEDPLASIKADLRTRLEEFKSR